MNWYVDVLKNYATFSGRARRTEYWAFVLLNACAAGALAVIDVLLDTMPVLTVVYAFGVMVPTLAVTVRRLHDIGCSGWWYLISFVPFGGIVLFIFTVLPGNSGDNLYGRDPRILDELRAGSNAGYL
jgi:uncharacterized membrane protein YhaH (DUF805 family)